MYFILVQELCNCGVDETIHYAKTYKSAIEWIKSNYGNVEYIYDESEWEIFKDKENDITIKLVYATSV